MRHSGSWQSVWDDRILEWIFENEGAGTASEMKTSDRIRISRSQISRRLSILAEHELLLHVGNGAYIITDEGEAYLHEEYDAEGGVYLSDPEPGTDTPTSTETEADGS
jgi:AraC-like DNA-binding protein